MENENQLIRQRKEKLQKIRELGINPYPPRCKFTHYTDEIKKHSQKIIEQNTEVSIAGRIRSLRNMGRASFAHIEDKYGKIQIYVREDKVGKDNYKLYKQLDLGDIIYVNGNVFRTKTGELTIAANKIELLTKTIRPIPVVKEKETETGEKLRYDVFADVELRYRKRYLDLLLNKDVCNVFQKRALIIKKIREFLDTNGFCEVETPILQPVYGGANARPFITHHNTLDIDLYLRIAVELYLKRLIIGGMDRVYELAKTFRNEGMDRLHNPEFTLLELYQAYGDYNDMMDLLEDLLIFLVKEVSGNNVIKIGAKEITFKKPFYRLSMIDLIKEHTDFDPSDFDRDQLIKFCKNHNIEYKEYMPTGKLIEQIFAKFVENKLIQPTYVVDFPKDISPLAKTKEDNPLFVERFELFINGEEYGNAFTELNDPIEQRDRLEKQAKLRDLGDVSANVVDEDFLEALEYGMPPTGGLGVGIDRLVMLLTNSTSIKDVILFPQMKPIK